MNWPAIVVVLGAVLASVVVYAVVGRILPHRWRSSDAEGSAGFTIASVNVLIGLLFSILLAFLIATVLGDFDKASSDAQDEANAIGAVHSLAHGITQPAQSLWKADTKSYTIPSAAPSESSPTHSRSYWAGSTPPPEPGSVSSTLTPNPRVSIGFANQRTKED